MIKNLCCHFNFEHFEHSVTATPSKHLHNDPTPLHLTTLFTSNIIWYYGLTEMFAVFAELYPFALDTRYH